MTEADRNELYRLASKAKHALDCIFGCDGWQEALASHESGNVTHWMGPRLHDAAHAVEAMKSILGGER